MPRWLVRDVMTAEVITMPYDAPFAEIAVGLARYRISAVAIIDRLHTVIGVMHRKGIGRLLVTDRKDRLRGIVTQADLLKVDARLGGVIRGDVTEYAGSRGFDGDIVDEWGRQSFPASDPPSNW